MHDGATREGASMSAPAGPPAARVPTLTEVVHESAIDAGPTAEAAAAQYAAKLPQASEEQLVQRVLADVQRQVDTVLEVRLREAITPALTRLTDALLRETRAELTATLRDVVARAVAQELSRHRNR
jgi:hypothetical protein